MIYLRSRSLERGPVERFVGTMESSRIVGEINTEVSFELSKSPKFVATFDQDVLGKKEKQVILSDLVIHVISIIIP